MAGIKNLSISSDSTRCPKIKVSIKSFNSDLLITLLHSYLTSLDSVDLQDLFDISFIRFESMKVKLQSFFVYLF